MPYRFTTPQVTRTAKFYGWIMWSILCAHPRQQTNLFGGQVQPQLIAIDNITVQLATDTLRHPGKLLNRIGNRGDGDEVTAESYLSPTGLAVLLVLNTFPATVISAAISKDSARFEDTQNSTGRVAQIYVSIPCWPTPPGCHPACHGYIRSQYCSQSSHPLTAGRPRY